MNLKIGIIIPDRGDRPLFLANCIRMIENQSLQPHKIILANEENNSNECDITTRYRESYEKLNDLVDVVLFIENDDYYAENYIETMIMEWLDRGMPDLLGTNYTIYYHLGLKKYFTMNHNLRASAMNTLLKSNLNINWGPENDPYTDIHIWTRSNLLGVTFKPKEIISIGMKHGIGMCGGRNHTNYLERFINDDFSMDFLRKNTDLESFNFYSKININNEKI